MPISAAQLRADLYRLLDQAIATGEPIEIERRGVVVLIVPPAPAVSWVDRLVAREPVVVGDPDSIVHVDWADAGYADPP
jgi:antitoxin (DNA-binding transcriptional repressor) of toxin-antitoxin stability system